MADDDFSEKVIENDLAQISRLVDREVIHASVVKFY